MFEKKRGKRFLASVMALVMLLSLAPVGALAAETTNTFEATAYTQGIEGSSPNGKTKAYAMWKDTDNNYYLAIASVEGNNKVDEAFQEKFPNAQYIENDQGLTVELDGEAQIDNLQPKQVADNGNGGPEGVWIILVMTPEELKKLDYNNSNGTFNLGISAGGFNLKNGTITINDQDFKGTVDGDVNPTENEKKVIYDENLPDGCNFVNGVTVPGQVSTTESSIMVAGLTGNVTENQVSGQDKTYTFQGWSENRNATEASYQVGDSLDLTEKEKVTTLYAIWKDTTESTPDHTPDSPRLVTAKFYINLGGEDASNREGIGEFTGAITINDALNYTLFEQKQSKDMKSNNGYIFERNGVKTVAGCEGNNLLRIEPRDDQINSALSAANRPDLSVGGDDNRYVVWYHVSDCTKMPGNQGYHVDGYIANRPITITYDPNEGVFSSEVTTDSFGKHTINDCKSGATHEIIDATPTRDGYEFVGWKLGDENKIYQSTDSIVPTGDVTLVAQWRSNVEPVTLTYHENFGKTEHTYAISVDKDSTQTIYSYETVRNLSGVFGQNTGYLFDGWTVSEKRGSGDNIYRDGDSIEMSRSINLYAQWKKARVPKVAYTINQHFINEKNRENTTLVNSQYKSAEQGTVLDTLITKTLKENKKDSKNNVYVYIADKTTFKVGTTKVDGTTTTLSSKDTVIDLYYYLDNWKDAGEAGKDSENGGDGIPDCDQVLIKYASSNSERGTVSPDMEVLTLRKDNENVQIKINGSKATDNGGRNYFSNWTDEVNNKTINDATLTADTIKTAIKTAKGGETYTFTANFGYSGGGGSGGSSRPSTPPTVDIPDDVPTGLNGKDHYAYIIGYGNNDVRPQNNITRAEVATIFFRLLTDETREANMTKSNGYNDVKDGDWFCCAVSTLSKMGIIKGYEDGSFKPNDPISRAEFAAIAARFDPDGDKTPATFADVTSHWAKDEISIAANHGWIKGYEDGSFKPDQKITRAETMTLVNRVLNRLPETKDDLHKDMKTWVDNMDETAWYYLAVQEATNSHYFKNKTSTKFEQWTDLRDTRDWSELEK